MNETKFDWDDLRLFLEVARAGGLAAASERTGKSAPTLGRRMLHLEKELGKELFHRHARGYDLTEDGHKFKREIDEIASRIAPLHRSAEDSKTTLVKISAGTWVTLFLARNIQKLTGGSGDVRLRFISDEAVLDIGHREAVIGVRNRRPEQIGLACRTVGRVHFAGYAVTPEIQTWVKVLGTTPSALWLRDEIRCADFVEVTSPRSALDLAMSGQARAVLPTFIGDRESPLTRVTDPIAELSHDQWLVSHEEERFVPEIRRTIEYMAKLLTELHREGPRSGAPG
ncbi:LysR family transcriptional regulator [Nisaea acidiphila]|uniref:LysR family transcriptional regulator n=1 Tax=Nisaea acidiphila TaxID=1862145 RepID=A0A9J7ASR9_9PROT|nr:LysR family transcriptional regulator [Nisaea acidiphila]UUX50384.1 LysR family transcriptional regulator [Nisaea acidiphila]